MPQMRVRYGEARGILIGAGMLLGLAACASGPAPDAEMAAAELALGQAEDADAAARAPAPYALARDKLERARAAMADGENIEARRLAEQALVDAQLAQAAARSEIARQNATELRQSIETLREELARRDPATS
jgi:Domain of unknown function (DUF4398)